MFVFAKMISSYFFASLTFWTCDFCLFNLFKLVFMQKSYARLLTHATTNSQFFIFFFIFSFSFIIRNILISIKITLRQTLWRTLRWTLQRTFFFFFLLLLRAWRQLLTNMERWLFRLNFWNLTRNIIFTYILRR